MMIHAPKMKIIEPDRELVAPLGMKGYYKLVATNRYTGRQRLLADWFPNLVTDFGLNYLGTTGGYLTWCSVGTSSTAPNVLDTALGGFVGSTATVGPVSSTASAESTPPYYGTLTKSWRFAEGVAAGNLSEIGAGPTSNGLSLFSRALILDSLGAPTTITVLGDEFLDAYYQLRHYPVLDDVLGEVVIAGVTHATVTRAASVTSASSWANSTSGLGAGVSPGSPAYIQARNGALGAITSSPAGTSSNRSSYTVLAYSAQSYQRDITANWGLAAGNLEGGITALSCTLGESHGMGAFQISFTPAIDKTDVKVLDLTFRQSWARGPV